MAKIKELPNFKRPREKLIEGGAQRLTDIELLAVMLQKGTSKLGVMALAKRIDKLLRLNPNPTHDDLQAIPGVGPARAAQILALLEYADRRGTPRAPRIREPEDLLPLIRHHAYSRQERFLCVSINGNQELMSIKEVSVGELKRTLVHPREVFADAVAQRAAAVIVAHNHVDGDPQPSKHDDAVTERLVEAGKILGIHLRDHLIFTRTDHYSYLHEGRLHPNFAFSNIVKVMDQSFVAS